MNTRRIVAACTLAVMAASRLRAQGQAMPQAPGPRAPTRVPVTVVLDTTEAVARFSILRRADHHPLDVIVLYGPADAKTLSDAVYGLLIARATQGDTARQNGFVRTRGRDAAHPALPTPHFPWVERVVDDLRRAPRQIVTGVGNFRAVEIWLPPQRKGTPQAEQTTRPPAPG
jgi:hypothetical protein